ncbi:hypothetical protein FA15DRAFT_661238 [Coprinopsis marcescibilis]|uniref:Uncharacterized protein n=1 Tax=Coprinopsis marcescibilis TaxID=230819 RepID=A0A5C3KCL5_COPMA|nr:hypothetical protein FA15DRAFT_661238 [Coprinopsis marcescibilis]
MAQQAPMGTLPFQSGSFPFKFPKSLLKLKSVVWALHTIIIVVVRSKSLARNISLDQAVPDTDLHLEPTVRAAKFLTREFLLLTNLLGARRIRDSQHSTERRVLPRRKGAQNSESRQDLPTYQLPASGKTTGLTHLFTSASQLVAPAVTLVTPDLSQTTFSVPSLNSSTTIFHSLSPGLPLIELESPLTLEVEWALELPTPGFYFEDLWKPLQSKKDQEKPKKSAEESKEGSSEHAPPLPPVMAQPAKMKADMPAYGARGALKFTGKGRQLEEFWERFEELAVACNVDEKERAALALRFEELAVACNVDEKERAALALRYVKKSRDKDLWKGMKNYKWVVLGDFEKWKDVVNGAYTDSEKKREYTYSDLIKERDFMNYYCKFVSISQGLLSNGKIVEEQANRFFWQGLHQKTRKTIKKRLEVMDKDREADAIPSIEDALKAGQYMYSEKSFEHQYDGSGKHCRPWAGSDNSSSDSSSESESDSSSESSESDLDSDASASSSSESEREGRKKKKKGKKVKKRTDKKKQGKEKEREEVVTKRVVVEDPEKKRLDEIEELSARLRGMKVTEPAYAGLYTRLKAMDNSLVDGVRNPWQQEALYGAYIDSYNVHTAVQSQVQPG